MYLESRDEMKYKKKMVKEREMRIKRMNRRTKC